MTHSLKKFRTVKAIKDQSTYRIRKREGVREPATPKLRPARQTIPKAQAKDITMAF